MQGHSYSLVDSGLSRFAEYFFVLSQGESTCLSEKHSAQVKARA